MDNEAFDRLARGLGTPGTRRAALIALLGTLPAALLVPQETAGKGKRRRDKRKGKRKRGRGGDVVVCHSGETLQVPRHAVRAIELDGGTLGACAPSSPRAGGPPPDGPPPPTPPGSGPPTSCAPDTRQWAAQTAFATVPLAGGVAASADGQTVLVAEFENHRIAVWERSGGAYVQQPSFGRQILLFNPIGLAVSADGRTAWVVSNTNNRISVWTKAGSTWTNQATFGSRGQNPDQFEFPWGIAVSRDEQTVWVADTGNHRISVWTKSGNAWVPEASFGSRGQNPDQFGAPRGLAVSADGQTVWVADTPNHRISVWTKSGNTWAPLTTFGSKGDGPGQLDTPTGVAVSADGQTVWVGDFFNHRVSVWTRLGSTWTNQATFGRRGTAPNEFRGPDWLAVSADEQTVWVIDTDNRRVSVWELICPPA